MRFKVETITPERARRMLDKTEQLGLVNRSVRPLRVEMLAHAIRAGQWQVTHQGLALSPDGAVLDGQHRLHAIIVADQDVDMIVVRDADPETFKVLDTGTARTTGDSLKINGETDTNHLAAIVRGFLAYEHSIGTTESFEKISRTLTTADVLDYLDDHDRRERALGALSASRSVASGLARHGLRSSLGVAILTISSRENELGDSTVAEFFARLGDGVSLGPDSPILALRRWMTSDTGYARIRPATRRSVATANTIKAVNDYALGRPRSVIVFRIGVEPFPAPLPPGSRLAWEQELARREATADELDGVAVG